MTSITFDKAPDQFKAYVEKLNSLIGFDSEFYDSRKNQRELDETYFLGSKWLYPQSDIEVKLEITFENDFLIHYELLVTDLIGDDVLYFRHPQELLNIDFERAVETYKLLVKQKEQEDKDKESEFTKVGKEKFKKYVDKIIEMVQKTPDGFDYEAGDLAFGGTTPSSVPKNLSNITIEGSEQGTDVGLSASDFHYPEDGKITVCWKGNQVQLILTADFNEDDHTTFDLAVEKIDSEAKVVEYFYIVVDLKELNDKYIYNAIRIYMTMR